MSEQKRMNEIRRRRTTAKASEPAVVSWKAEIRSDFRDAMQTRIAEALARTQPAEPAAMNRAKGYSLGVINAMFAALADLPASTETDELLIGLGMAGLGANVTQDTDDREVIGRRTRDVLLRLLETEATR